MNETHILIGLGVSWCQYHVRNQRLLHFLKLLLGWTCPRLSLCFIGPCPFNRTAGSTGLTPVESYQT